MNGYNGTLPESLHPVTDRFQMMPWHSRDPRGRSQGNREGSDGGGELRRAWEPRREAYSRRDAKEAQGPGGFQHLIIGSVGGGRKGVSRLRRAHKDPLGILAGASTLDRFATSWARGKLHLIGQRLLNAAALGTIQAVDMANIACLVHNCASIGGMGRMRIHNGLPKLRCVPITLSPVKTDSPNYFFLRDAVFLLVVFFFFRSGR